MGYLYTLYNICKNYTASFEYQPIPDIFERAIEIE